MAQNANSFYKYMYNRHLFSLLIYTHHAQIQNILSEGVQL